MPNIFVYVGEENDPAVDGSHSHIALLELQDGPLQDCGHNLYQRWDDQCHGCEAREEAHR